MAARARSSIGCATSASRTEKPDCANTWAMPLPIVPAPITPTVLMVMIDSCALDGERDAIAPAEAQRRNAAFQVPPLQRVEQGGQHAAAARSDRVPQGD